MASRSGLLALIVVALMMVGCAHRVVSEGDEHTVKLYPDEATYEKLKDMKKQGGPMGMLGGLGEGFVIRELDNKTPVRVISSDSEGAMVEVTDGPHKGMQGFVRHDNLD